MVREINDLAPQGDWVLPGLVEGQLLTGRRDASSIADWYFKRGVVSVVAVQDGGRGADLFTRDGLQIHQPPPACHSC